MSGRIYPMDLLPGLESEDWRGVPTSIHRRGIREARKRHREQLAPEEARRRYVSSHQGRFDLGS